jgi:polar amino acid transport system substrate-binding protein
MRLRTMAKPAVLALAAALALTACGSDDDTGGEATETSTEATEATESEMTESEMTEGTEGSTEAGGEMSTITEGTLTVCSDIPYAPFEFEEGGEITGFDIEIMQAIADELGLELEVNAIGFDPIQSGTALNSEQCDVAASAMTITEEREENLDFSDPYYDAKQSLLTAEDSGISTIEDLSGVAVGVQSATTGETYARENAPDDAEITAFENPGDLLTALQANQVDAVLQDLPVNAEFARNNEGFAVVEEYDTGEQYGFAVAEEGSDALLANLNDALQAVRDSGTYDEVYDKYFAAE